MLSRVRRLARKDFPQYPQKRVLWSGATIKVSCYPSKLRQNKAKFSVVVGKKFYKTIVERNHFKRLVYTALVGHLERFDRSGYEKFLITPVMSVEKLIKIDVSADIERLSMKTSHE